MGCEGSKTKTPPANKDEDLAVVQHDAYLLRLVSAHNIPSLDRFSESDVYAIASLMEGGKVVATARWPVKPDSVQPVWDSCRSLGAASSRARVLLQFYDQDEASPLDLTRRLTASSPDFIGEIELGVEDLPNSGEPLTIPLRTKHRPRASGSASCTLSRAPPEAHTAPRQKTLFLIRHGESVWNQAQADKDMVAMLSDVDHPLNQLGRLQAEGLAAHLAAEMSAGAAGAPVSGVLDVQAVLCSPLTRAVQTCLIGLRPLLLARPAGERAEDDVPAAPRIGVVELNPNMREKRNLMGKDSSGKHFGHQMTVGTHASLRTLYEDDPHAAEALCSVKLGLGLVGERWWIGNKESEAALIGRIDDLWAQIQYSPHSRIALVGHSHFFRFLLRRHLDAGARLLAADGSEADANALRSQKLCNGGGLRCEVDFRGKSPSIGSAQLLFDTVLVD